VSRNVTAAAVGVVLLHLLPAIAAQYFDCKTDLRKEREAGDSVVGE